MNHLVLTDTVASVGYFITSSSEFTGSRPISRSSHSVLHNARHITADGDCSNEIKRCLPLGRKVRTNLDSILKSRDITLPTKVHLVKAMVFPVVMYGYESWTVKKTEHRRIDAFELWCRRRLLRVPWTAKRSNQSFLKDISPGLCFGRTDVEVATPILWPPDAKR